MKRKILIISSFAPPMIHVATNRINSFIEQFKNADYSVTVLTLLDSEISTKASDKGFQVEMINGVKFIRLMGNSIFNLSSFHVKTSVFFHKLKALKNKILNLWSIDDKPGFFTAFVKNEQKLSLENFDFVLSSFAPLSPHLIAMKMKEHHPKTKWIADFRDEMSFLPSLNVLQKWRLKKAETLILQNADYITAVSEPILTELMKNPHTESTKALEIRNGYNFEPLTNKELQKSVFSWAYFGTFYGGRNPLLFFETMTLFKKKYPQQKIRIDFYCGASALQTPTSIRDEVFWHEKVPYSEVPLLMADASVLLLVQAITTRKGVFSGKIFDYLAVNRPILALVDETDVAATLIRECRSGYVAHHDEFLTAPQLLDLIEKIYFDWKENRLPDRNWELVTEQSRKNQISKLISALKVGSSII